MNFKKQLDPRTVILIVVINSFVAVISQKALLSLLSTLLILFFNLYYRTDLKGVLRKCKRLWQVVIFAALMQSIFVKEGMVIFRLFDVPIVTTYGIEKGVIIILRLFAIMCGAAAIATYSQGKMIEALVRLGFSYEFAYMVIIAIKFLPMLNEEMQDSLVAIQLRGINLEKLSWSKKIKIYSYLLFPIISGTLIRAKDLAASMEMRGFRAYKKHTSMIELNLRCFDYIFGLIFCTAEILLVIFV